MDDEVYAARLLAILTNPHPTGIDPEDPCGTADDGIDRYDGFGSDVRVESASVVPGDHGPEVELHVVLAGERSTDAVRRGSLRVPVEAEWRRLSGYDDPAAYAPRVATEVWLAASNLDQPRRPQDAPRPADLPTRDEQRRLLVEELALFGDVTEVSTGRLQVRPPPPDPVVTVVVPGDEWEAVWADDPDGDPTSEVGEVMATLDPDERFVVLWQGRLVGSAREELPPVRGRATERAMAALRDATGPVGWTAERPDQPGSD